jgi:2,4-dienoyl-CoA reductase-like NADH-dependent reductase (Old Yellow Enzyme family)/thioredoxin reductase
VAELYSSPFPNLMKPLKVKDLIFKNRIMSAPNMLFHTVDGRPTDFYISYLEHKARGGAALVTLGEVAVCDGGNHTPWTRWTRDNLPLYAEMAAAIHEHGALAAVELTHGGQNARPEFNTVPVKGPVETVNHMGAKVLAMDESDMAQVADSYADAAVYFYHAGFDAVLVHAAHGWIFNQFLSPLINRRTDRYGGSLENRMRFPLMVLERIRERIGPARVLMLRLSGAEREDNGYTVDDIITFLSKAQAYVDLAEISSDGLTNMMASTYRPLGLNVPFAEAIKKSGKVRIPIFSIGSILYPEQAEAIIAAGRADGVSLSRALIADPFWVKKAAAGRPDDITPCLRCLNCTDSDNASRHFVCSVNPYIGREARIGFADTMTKANVRKRVLVVGGGPAGLTAAVTAARRGHEVTLCEKSGALGGMLRFADTDSLKHDLRRYKDYLVRRTCEMNVRILLNTEADDTLLAQYQPEAIIIATGSRPAVPPVRGIDRARHAADVYFEPESIGGENIVIIGGGLVGIETGLHLKNIGKSVTVLEMREDYAPEAGFCYRAGLVRTVEEMELCVITGAAAREVTDAGVTYEKDGKQHFTAGNTVLYATGMMPYDAPYFDLYDKAPVVYLAGDCKKAGKVDGAVHSGFFAAMDIGML